MLFVFFSLTLSTLKPGEDPYKILGLSHKATDEEVRKAFLDITKKYHPDINKEPGAEKIWVHANDAYELLHNQERRRIYDQTGSVADDPFSGSGQSGYTSTAEDIINEILRSFGFQPPKEVKMETQEVNSKTYKKLLHEHKELFVYVYDPNDIFDTPKCAQFYEAIAKEYGHLAKFLRNNVETGNEFSEEFQIKTTPRFLYLKIGSDGEIISKVSGNIDDRIKFINWMVSCWNPDYRVFTRVSDLQNWLEKYSHYTCVYSIVRTSEPSIEFKRMSAKYRECKFAVLTDDYANAIRTFHLKEIPSNFVVRAGVHTITHNYQILKTLSKPLFVDMSKIVFEEICNNLCLMYVGDVNKEIIDNFTNVKDASITNVKSNSMFAKQLKAKDNEWFLVSNSEMKYTKINIDNYRKEIESFWLGELTMSEITQKPGYSWNDKTEIVRKYALMLRPSNWKQLLLSIGIDVDSIIFFAALFILLVMLYKFCCCCCCCCHCYCIRRCFRKKKNNEIKIMQDGKEYTIKVTNE
ncbi:molecular chaperone DnaJ [Histomonas meleagridis]|uniref:molecular chaperone DnaJ n=1 Tax=Histomonas meleagridis TaxID=135588 RepID=UPI00355A1F4A|nr:molecular chaperone DnaJ [Histomonas meleagridis]KAH0802735.1 molecular chaperone DnaJ [Histomonas meleagridis]